MLQTPPRGTLFYRVTDSGQSWPDVLSGVGAYFSFGGRYNRVHQKVVYAAEDPLVSIAEYAFHQAVELHMLIGGGPLSAHPPLAQPPLPFVSEHLLWCFTLRNAPPVLDVEDPVALHTFHHRPYELLNPSSEDYHRTSMLADLIRQHPNPQHPVAGGILAPSVRTPASPGYTPRQHIFFLPPNVLTIPGRLLRRWRLTIEFRDVAGHTVTPQTRDIAWARPWFRLSGARTPVPTFPQRPHSHPFASGTWYQTEIKFV
jgi:RES domain